MTSCNGKNIQANIIRGIADPHFHLNDVLGLEAFILMPHAPSLTSVDCRVTTVGIPLISNAPRAD